MSVELIWKHQQKTYELIKEALQKSKRAAYVFPTGCGKSFPTLKYIEDNPDKNILIVSPSKGINNQFKKYIKEHVENGEERLKNKNITIVTYQKISLMKKLVKDLKIDTIVLDEIHRAGAETWEPAVNALINEFPEVEVIGMSATPERTDKRNMAYEIFGDNVVYEMSLTEALSGDKEGEVVLKTPRYVRALSMLKEQIKGYKEEIELIEDEEKKKRLLKRFEKLDEIISNAPGLEDVMVEGMQKKNGKYIVFCKDRDDLEEKMNQAQKIFGKVNSKMHIDYVLTKDDGGAVLGKTPRENRKTLEEFEKRKTSDELNLLFCVDMLNEGIHVEGIDGVVLFDLTTSPVLYKQRIGRALSSDKEAAEAVIIDPSNNWLNQIESYREIEEAIKRGGKINSSEKYDLLELMSDETDLLVIMREIDEELKYNKKLSLRYSKEIKKWCETRFKDEPIEERRLPSLAGENDEEKKLAKRLSGIRQRILNNYKGKKIEEIEDEEHRQIVEIIRNLDKEYGISEHLKNAIKIKKWCERIYHDKPIKERRLPSQKARNEEEKLFGITLNTIRQKVSNQYEGIPLEEIEDEEHREIVRIIRELDENYMSEEQRKMRNSMLNRVSHLEQVIEIRNWCERVYGDKPIEERCLPNKHSKDDEEKKLGQNLSRIRQVVLKKYEGMNLEEIENKEHRQIIEIIKKLDKEYNISPYLKQTIRIKKWCEDKFKDKPIEERRLPSSIYDEEERKFHKDLNVIRKKITNQYEGIPLEKIENEDHRQIVEIVRFLYSEYDIPEYLKNAIKIKKWCEKVYGDKPREKRKLPSNHSKDDEIKNLGEKLNNIRIGLTNKYEGISLEEIDDEIHREIVKIIRELEDQYMSSRHKKIRDARMKSRMKKEVGKHIGSNDETRAELEEKTKRREEKAKKLPNTPVD